MNNIILLVIMAVLMAVVSPLAIIWALNTLLSLAIPYNVWTYLATLVLFSTIKVKHSK
jgi:hypothetical protein